MEIIINKEKLKFTLENERNLLQVLDTIENWLLEQKFVINSIAVNGKELSTQNRDELEAVDISKIELLDIETTTQTEMAFSSLQRASEYTDTFLAEIEKGRDDFLSNKDEKIEGIRWLTEVVFGASVVLNVNVSSTFYNEHTLEEVIAFLKLSYEHLDSMKHDDLFFYNYFLSGIKEKLEVLQKFIPVIISRSIFEGGDERSNFKEENILTILLGLKDNLYHITPLLSKVSEKLQSGNDIEALIGIKKMACALDNLIGSLKRLEILLGMDFKELEINGKKLDEINRDLLKLLNEMFVAFQNQDAILLADLIEYEMNNYFAVYKDVLEMLIIITGQKKMVN